MTIRTQRHLHLLIAIGLQLGALPAAADLTARATTVLNRPDLVQEQKQEGSGRYSFTVKNNGGAEAHSSKLKINCQELFSASGFKCAFDSKVIDVPPIAKGGSYHSPQSYQIISSGADAKPAGPPWFRLKITVTADADGQVAEGNENNNKWVLTVENFQGAQPPLVAEPATAGDLKIAPKAGPLGTVEPASAESANASSVKLAPKVSLETETKPFDPATTNWLLVRNTG